LVCLPPVEFWSKFVSRIIFLQTLSFIVHLINSYFVYFWSIAMFNNNTCVLWLILTALSLGLATELSARQPNVIIFLADDEGYGELGAQGNPEIPTSNIDSLAKNGTRFTDGYVAATYCSPCRAGLMTGKYPTRFGHEFNPNGKDGLPLDQTTFAQRFKEIGYTTICVGKWHLGSPEAMRPHARGFDEFYGTLANTPFINPTQFMDTRKSKADILEMNDPSFYTTDAYAARAVEFITANKDKPFLLYLPFNAQHAPLQAPQKYLDRFPNIKDEKRKLFAAMLSAQDDAVGKVLQTLRDNQLENDTLIWYFADNGGPTQSTTSKNDPLRGYKMTTLEGGTRVPFMVQWKGKIPAGQVYKQPIIQLDILPTSLLAAGGKVSPDWKLDGVNILPHLLGENKAAPHETLYWRFGEQWAVRRGDWKLCVNRIDGVKASPGLYNLTSDIGEAKNVASEHPEKVKELQTAWDAWNKEQSEPLWKPNDMPKKQQKKGKQAAPKLSLLD
jgi:arylsulfatase A-like enzyme